MPSAVDVIRVGIVGLGGNTRLRHVPGLRACPQVEISAVCNRSMESSRRAAREFGIPRVHASWEDLIADESLDAVLVGTWPYLHCPITLAALAAGKHVLTEARMAMNAAEAHMMLEASRRHPQLVTQIVPSPFGLRAHRVLRELLSSGWIGELREVVCLGTNDSLADAASPLAWRQVAAYSGMNSLVLGILHETLIRFVPDPVKVFAQASAFTPERLDESTGQMQAVGTPDSMQVLTEISGGARGLYHVSGVARFGPGIQIHLYGSKGTLKYEMHPQDRLMGGRAGDTELREIEIRPEQAMGWRVEEEFIQAIRGQGVVEFTDFATGVRYMEFTEAVARSVQSEQPVTLPLEGFPTEAPSGRDDRGE